MKAEISEISHSKSSRIVKSNQKQNSVVRKYKEIKEKKIKGKRSKRSSATQSFIEPNLSENMIPNNLEKKIKNERACSSSHSTTNIEAKNKIKEKLKNKDFKKVYGPVLMNTSLISKAINNKSLNKKKNKVTPYVVKKHDINDDSQASKYLSDYKITDLSIDSLSSTKVRLSEYAKTLSKDDKISSLSNFLETNKFEAVFTK